MEYQIPENLLCTKSHEYVYENDNSYFVGITDHAVEQLGDVVFVELPEVDSTFEKGEVFASVESVKAASEVYLPISGKIVEINEALIANPELVNTNPYKDGWFVKIEPADITELDTLMEYEDYKTDIK